MLRIPIAHGEGRYTIDDDGLRRLQDENRVLFRYVNERGEQSAGANPNGATDDIAGIVNDRGNVMGLMPHPERAVDATLGSTDGLGVFESILARVAA